MSEPERIRITRDDAYSPRVDEVLAREGSFGMRPDQFMGKAAEKRSGLARFLYSSVFYTAVAGATGACIGWAIMEPFFGEEQIKNIKTVEDFILFLATCVLLEVCTVGVAAAFIGAVEPISGRNWGRAVTGAFIGLGTGLVGAALLWYPGGVLYQALVNGVISLSGMQRGENGQYDREAMGAMWKMALMVARAIGWTPMGLVVGLGPAIHMRSGKLAFNGIIGGLLGAFLGGLLFDPIYDMFRAEEAWLSRGFGFTAIGLGAGVMIGLVENLAKTAWLHVKAGALAGKQFVIYKNPTVLGSSPKCEIYLFKDEAIEPKHAAIHSYGTRYEIEDLDTPAGTFVNGRRITRQPLKNGDLIYLGETVLDFSEKESG